MVRKTNRQRNIRLPYNIWTGEKSHELRPDETICDECKGHGGYSDSGKGEGLIQMCSRCEGNGYRDWIDRAKGSPDCIEFVYFISHPSEQVAAVVKKGEEEKYKERIRLQQAGQFKFKEKDEI